MSFLPNYVLTENVNVYRRVSYIAASRDALNNPVYGNPESWNLVYSNMPCRLSYNDKKIRFAPTGELIQPTAELIYDSSTYTMQAMDKINITISPGWPTGTEYYVNAVYTSFYEQGIPAFGKADILLPII